MPDQADTRAVSEVLGYSLIFGMILVAIAFISVGGVASLEDARDAEQNNNAERAFDVLSNNVEDVYRRGAPSRATELSLGGAQLYVADEVTLNVTVDDGSDPVHVESTVRPLVFQGSDDVEFVYVAGAIFRAQRDGGIAIRDFPLTLNDRRMILPLVATHSDHVQSIGGPAVLVRTVETDRRIGHQSSASSYTVTVNVTDSPRAALWQRHLSERFGMDCTTTGDSVICSDDTTDPNRVLVTVHDVRVELET